MSFHSHNIHIKLGLLCSFLDVETEAQSLISVRHTASKWQLGFESRKYLFLSPQESDEAGMVISQRRKRNLSDLPKIIESVKDRTKI